MENELTSRDDGPRKARWIPRFSLRFLLLASSFCSCVLGWTVLRYEQRRKESEIVIGLQVFGVGIEPIFAEPNVFEKVFGERFSKRSWRVSLDQQDLEHFDRIAELEDVKSIFVFDCDFPDLTCFSKFQNLKSLSIWNARKVRFTKPLGTLKNLERLSFYQTRKNGCQFEGFEETLHEMRALKSFVARESPVDSLEAFANCKKLEHLELWMDGSGITSLKGLDDLPRLTGLELVGISEVTDLRALESMSQLTEMRLTGLQVGDLDFLRSLNNLKSLDLQMNHELLTQDGMTLGEALQPMLLPTIEKLHISTTDLLALSEQAGLEKLVGLQDLKVRSGTRSFDFAPLQALESLRTLRLRQLPDLKSMDGVESLESLRRLDVGGCHNLSDIQCLQRLDSLGNIRIFPAKNISPQQIIGLRLAFPEAWININ